MATRKKNTLFGKVLGDVKSFVIPETDPSWDPSAAIAEQNAKEQLEAMAAAKGVSTSGLALMTSTTALSVQSGMVTDTTTNDVEIKFPNPVDDPVFLISNLWNAQGSSSDIGYDPATLTSNGVTVKRGYGMNLNGLQPFAWFVISAAPTAGNQPPEM